MNMFMSAASELCKLIYLGAVAAIVLQNFQVLNERKTLKLM